MPTISICKCESASLSLCHDVRRHADGFQSSALDERRREVHFKAFYYALPHQPPIYLTPSGENPRPPSGPSTIDLFEERIPKRRVGFEPEESRRKAFQPRKELEIVARLLLDFFHQPLGNSSISWVIFSLVPDERARARNRLDCYAYQCVSVAIRNWQNDHE